MWEQFLDPLNWSIQVHYRISHNIRVESYFTRQCSESWSHCWAKLREQGAITSSATAAAHGPNARVLCHTESADAWRMRAGIPEHVIGRNSPIFALQWMHGSELYLHRETAINILCQLPIPQCIVKFLQWSPVVRLTYGCPPIDA